MPAVSVIIPAYNEEKHLAQCLKALEPQLTDGDEIIVVDNNSTDSTVEVTSKFKVSVVKESKQGLSFARNKGFEEARNKILARTDADTVVSDEWLDSIRSFYSQPSANNVAVTGPVYLIEPQPMRLCLHSGITKRRLGHQNLIGSNMAMPMSLWVKIAPQLSNDDERYAEDTEISGLVIKSGGAIEFVPKMKVFTSWRWMRQHPLKNYRQWKQKLNNTTALFDK
jgi:glycosyltransferase involved in cell wall biosynthesis